MESLERIAELETEPSVISNVSKANGALFTFFIVQPEEKRFLQ